MIPKHVGVALKYIQIAAVLRIGVLGGDTECKPLAAAHDRRVRLSHRVSAAIGVIESVENAVVLHIVADPQRLGNSDDLLQPL